MKHLLAAFSLILVGCVGTIEDPHSLPEPQLKAECGKYMVGDYQKSFAPQHFPVNVVIDTSISDHNIGLFLQAIDRWNEKIGSEVLYATITSHLDMHGPCNFTILKDDMALPKLPDGSDEIGVTSYGKCADDFVYVETMETPMKITPNDYFTDAAVTNIAEHELGHVLGLDHEDDNPKSIMYHSVGSDPRIISEKSYCLVQILLSVSGY